MIAKDELEKILLRKDFKDANNMDTLEESSAILNEFQELAGSIDLDEEEYGPSDSLKNILSTLGDVSPIPIVACRTYLPIYYDLFNGMVSVFESWDDNGDISDFEKSFDLFSEFFSDYFGDAMFKFADWAKEELLEDISMQDIPYYRITAKVGHEDFAKLLNLLKKANKHIEPALDSYSKSRCIVIYPIINSIIHTISYLIAIKKADRT